MRISLLLCLFVSPVVFAITGKVQEDIRFQVEHFVHANIEAMDHQTLDVQVGHLDSRLRLTACAQPLHVFVPPGQHFERMSMAGVRCDAPKPWKIFVPVQIRLMSPVVSLQNAISRNQIIGRHDVQLSPKNILRSQEGYFERLEDVVGMKARFSMRRGQVIRPRMIKAPTLVKKGEHVAIILRKNQLEVRMKGIAQKDGSAGMQIPVKNISSKKTIFAQVQADGTVVID